MRFKQSVLIFLVLMLFAFMGYVQAAQMEKSPYLIYEGHILVEQFKHFMVTSLFNHL